MGTRSIGPSGSPGRPGAVTALVVAVLAAGCGGKKSGDTTPPGGGGEDSEREERPRGGAMIPPDTMDEIRRDLDRKQRIISHCLATAVDNKELPKNSSGKVTLEIVIAPSGKAESVKIVRATLESKTLHECVIGHVQEIQFPVLPRTYETSYTYGFEAM